MKPWMQRLIVALLVIGALAIVLPLTGALVMAMMYLVASGFLP